MNVQTWVALLIAFGLGAMSPGPSLALVLRNTLSGGRRHGILTAIGHGFGFGIYALLVAFGIAGGLAAHPVTYSVLRWGGAGLLLYLGVSFLHRAWSDRQDPAGGGDNNRQPADAIGRMRSGFVQGLMLAILNPEILVWMLAIYAPFIHANSTTETLLAMGLMGMLIDGGWYASVAVALTVGDRLQRLQAVSHRIDAVMGVLMLGFAALIIGDYL